MAAIYETTETGDLVIRFPNGGQPTWGGATIPHGFVVSAIEQTGNGAGSILIKVTTLTPETKRLEYIAGHLDVQDRHIGEFGQIEFARDRASLVFAIGDDWI